MRTCLPRLALVLILMGLLEVRPAWAGFSVTTFSGSAFNSNTATMNSTLGITGYAIEDFEHASLIPGLSITFSGNVPSVTLTSLPRLFDTTDFPTIDGFTSFANNFWDGPHALANGNSGDNTFRFTFADRTSFSFAAPASSVGVGLANFQSATATPDNAFPITNHELLVNGVSLGTVEALAGANWRAGVEVRNAYIRIDASGGDAISSFTIRNISGQDGLVFDHLAVRGVAVPEPASAVLLGTGLLGLIGYGTHSRRRA